MNPDSSKLQEAGGPKIPMKYGRVDVSEPEQCPEEGRLPGKLTVIKWSMYDFYTIFGKV